MSEHNNVQPTQLERFDQIMALMGGVAHEINNPLTIILGFLDLELLEPNLNQEAISRLNIMRDEVVKIEDMLNQLLLVAYANQLPKESLQLNDFIREEVQHTQNLYPIEFDLNLENPLPPIQAVPIQIKNVIHELIKNAREAFEAQGNTAGKISIKTSRQDHTIYMRVEDNGPGIPSDIKDIIFRPFVTTKSKSKGQGLGLNLCYEWLKQHKGKIRLLTHDKEGTIFQIELPIAT